MLIVDKIKEHRNNVPKELEGIDELDSTTKDYMLYKFLKNNLNDYPYLFQLIPWIMISCAILSLLIIVCVKRWTFVNELLITLLKTLLLTTKGQKQIEVLKHY